MVEHLNMTDRGYNALRFYSIVLPFSFLHLALLKEKYMHALTDMCIHKLTLDASFNMICFLKFNEALYSHCS